MSFFDGVKPPRRARVTVNRQPEWAEPPNGVVPAVSKQRATLLKSDELALVLERFLVYPNGVSFRLGLFSESWRDDLRFPFSRTIGRGSAQETTMVQFGCEFSDGTAWTNMDAPRRPGDVDTGPVVSGCSGGGVGLRWFLDYWIWPLPPAGSIMFFAQWPPEGFNEHAVQISADELRALSHSAEDLWPS